MLERAARAGAASGTAAGVLSALTAAACSKLEEGSAAGALNGPSQWLWGEREAYTRRATLRHTAVGYVIHHSTAIMWATLHEAVFGRAQQRQDVQRQSAGHDVLRRCAQAAATTTVAYVTDYHLTPKRLRPGFKKHLGPASVFAVYATFAAGLALTAIARDLRRPGR